MGQKFWIIACFISAGLHAVLAVYFQDNSLGKAAPDPVKTLTMKIVSKPKPIVRPPAEPPPKPKSKPKPKAKPPKPKAVVQTTKKPIIQSKKDIPPVLGVAKTAVSEHSKMAVPVGNTLFTKDRGLRMNPDDVNDLPDLSQDARLLPASIVKPMYTEEAIDAGIEGIFVVDVFVDTEGRVTETELVEKIGFGMDSKVLKVAQQARYSPRKNKFGVEQGTWTQLKFRLQID